jgi:hypothetical protein
MSTQNIKYRSLYVRHINIRAYIPRKWPLITESMNLNLSRKVIRSHRTFLNAVTLAAKQISATILEEKKHNSGKTNY